MNTTRNTMVAIAAAAALLGGCRCPEAGGDAAYPETVDEGFVSLFDGKSLSGWYGSGKYAVETIDMPLANGTTNHVPVIAFRPGAGADAADRGNLLTEREYRNFVLRMDVLLPRDGDSGIGVRTPGPDADAAFAGMCEVQLLDDGGPAHYDAAAKKDKLNAWQYAGSVFGIAPSLRDNVGRQIWGKDANFAGGGSYVRRPGMWNFVEVCVIGDEIEVSINGYLVTKADLSAYRGDGDTPDGNEHPGLRNAKGHIGLAGCTPGVMFKNVRVKELPDCARMGAKCPQANSPAPKGFAAYFNGDPAQLRTMWKGVTTEEGFDNPKVRQAATPEKRAEMQKKADAGRDDHWSVRNGSLCFDGFKGGYSLATKRDFGDFELWADWRTMSITGDSGLYLRGSPQVQVWDVYNQWGIGSGGLYNNQKNPDKPLAIADRPVGDWNRFHVVMRGEKVSVWLNGVLVVDNVTLENFWDRSKPIFASEQIELQCHGDPTEWRNVFIKEL